jgi:8-oxo-dGTP diphosphatase
MTKDNPDHHNTLGIVFAAYFTSRLSRLLTSEALFLNHKVMKKISSPFNPADFLHVAVGVIKDTAGNILISQRPTHVHQGGLWEFPGGKVKPGESVVQALTRELLEELGVKLERCEPLIKIHHHYHDLSVLLDVWTVTDFSGVADSCEGQPIRWVGANELATYDFPAANLPIIHAAQLPCFYAIIDEANPAELMANLRKILSKDIRLIQARLKTLSALTVQDFLRQALPLCQQYNAQLLLNSAVKNAATLNSSGLHLTSSDLMRLTERPKLSGWLAASCHNLAQLRQAEKIGVDFVVLAPVLKTETHPTALILGWEQFAELVAEVNIPVYALGGVTAGDKNTAQALGGQGISGIRTFLS